MTIKFPKPGRLNQNEESLTMWGAQIARFQDPLLKEFKLACVSTQIWGMLHISFKSFLVDI
jgi:hypothetical protein